MASVLVCGVALFALSYQRYKVFFTRFADSDYGAEYTLNKSYQYEQGKSVSLSDFPGEKNITVRKTDIDLACTTQGIKARVIMDAVMDGDAQAQSFTLFSDLQVDEIWIDDVKVDFQRSHDGLSVSFPQPKKAGDSVRFVFQYHGYVLPTSPANETIVYLHRSFPWIPWPGIRTMSPYNKIVDLYGYSDIFFIEDFQKSKDVAYTLRYQGPEGLYTNLAPTETKGLYEGKSSDGISLYSGMVHYEYRDVDLYIPAAQYKAAKVSADALLDGYEPLLALCERMGASPAPQRPRSIVVIPMQAPLYNALVLRTGVYSQGEEWEIRSSNTIAPDITAKRENYGDDVKTYQSDFMATAAVAYLVTPCVHYPFDVSAESTKNFTAWLSIYLRAQMKFDSDDDFADYVQTLKDAHTGGFDEYVNDERVTIASLTSQERKWINEIIKRMKRGENFDGAYRNLYQRLMGGESISVSDIVTQIYNNSEE